jgi:hypothetical protein
MKKKPRYHGVPVSAASSATAHAHFKKMNLN